MIANCETHPPKKAKQLVRFVAYSKAKHCNNAGANVLRLVTAGHFGEAAWCHWHTHYLAQVPKSDLANELLQLLSTPYTKVRSNIFFAECTGKGIAPKRQQVKTARCLRSMASAATTARAAALPPHLTLNVLELVLAVVLVAPVAEVPELARLRAPTRGIAALHQAGEAPAPGMQLRPGTGMPSTLLGKHAA